MRKYGKFSPKDIAIIVIILTSMVLERIFVFVYYTFNWCFEWTDMKKKEKISF